jgi:hypothetical protein
MANGRKKQGRPGWGSPALVDTFAKLHRERSELRELHQSTADEHKELLSGIQKKIEAAEAAAKNAGERADEVKDKARRLRQGEAVAGGTKRLTEKDILCAFRDAGMTDRDIERCRMVYAIGELGGFEELLTEVHKRHRQAEFAAVRAVLRRRLTAVRKMGDTGARGRS